MSSYFQTTINLPAKKRGCHLITEYIVKAIPEAMTLKVGMLNIFIKHTSASLSINENADPDVRIDLEMALNKMAPESLPYIHTAEGADDMPAHVKSSLLGCSLNIPIGEGRLLLGMWQGIYLCEHRNDGGGRTIVLTGHGLAK